MNQPQFRFISLQENLLETVVDEIPVQDALLVFPTEMSRKAAMRLFQTRINFRNVQFMTIERVKELLFLADRPVLREEKRTLALYASLDKASREYFKINSYFQSIELAKQFFDLWNEFAEEGVPEDFNADRLASAGAELLPWQRQTFDQLKHIKARYREFIGVRGFIDTIFLQESGFELSFFQSYTSVVFVNQFYYTQLEKEIIHGLLRDGRHVLVYFQMPEHLVDRENLTARAFSCKDLYSGRSNKITAHICKNEFSMFVTLFRILQNHPIQNVVQVRSGRNGYNRFLSPEKFRVDLSVAIQETSVYRFFATVLNLLKEVIMEGKRGKRLLPIPALVQALQHREFYRYVSSHMPWDDQTRLQRALDCMHGLIDGHYQYIDLDGHFFHGGHPLQKEAAQYIEPVLSLLQMFMRIDDIGKLTDLIDDDRGIQLQKMLTDDEKEFSDIKDVFYHALADFSVLAELAIVDDWQSFLPADSPLTLAHGLLRLFLDYIKSKRVHFTRITYDTPRIDLTHLQDTRNLHYDRIAIIHLTEDALPSGRKVPFLFTEKQRQVLGLKTYDDVRLWEKYYFERLVLNTPDVHLFALKNIDKDVETSSFVEELMLQLPPHGLDRVEEPDTGYSDLYALLIPPDHSCPVPQQSDGFFSLPYEPGRDIERLCLTPYRFKTLKENPFEYYLRHVAHVPDHLQLTDVGLPPRLFGVLAHDYFNRCIHEFLRDDPLTLCSIGEIPDRYQDRVRAYLFGDNSEYYFKLPHNHERIYLQEIMLPAIHDSCRAFFQDLERRLPKEMANIRLFPEKEYVSRAEREAKLYLRSDENAMGIDVDILGRADLRIELANGPKKYIVDYKTGKGNYSQLLLYQLYYYVLDDPALADYVYCYLYRILEKECDSLYKLLPGSRNKLNAHQLIEFFRDEVRTVLADVVENGFKATRLGYRESAVHEITRIDLMKS
ncbi:PD-(D/E)XK nuclease family protein [candidate division KSB1 bacterium]|nr:PD-(D/E)XK nuclease family protein [candidate division KSB1 bacterium]